MNAAPDRRGLTGRVGSRATKLEFDWAGVAIGAVAFLVVAITYARIYFGADFTDQAYYVAIPYRFVLGARPFIDETTPSQQMAGLLAFPFIWAYHALFGVTAIILFARHLHLLFSLAVAAFVFVGLRPFTRTRSEAILASLVPVAFVPFNLPDLSYNNLASGFFVAGCFIGLRSLVMRERASVVAAGVAHGLAIFVYPTLVLPVLVYLSILVALGNRPGRRSLFFYTAGGLIPLAALVAVFAHAGLDNVRDVYSNARDFGNQGGGAAKALRVLVEAFGIGWRAPLGVLALIFVIAMWSRRPRLAVLLLWVTPVLLVPLPGAAGLYGSLYYVTLYGLLGLPLYVLRRNDPTTRRLFLAIWPAALVGGLATGWSSNGGVINFGLGFLPAAVLTTVLLMRAADAQWPSSEATSRREARLLLANSSLAVLLALQFTSVYRDDNINRLGSRVRSGAYAGIYTTAEKRSFIGNLTSDLRRLSPSSCRILFYDDFPAGYLLSTSHPYTNAAWLLRVPKSKTNAYRRVLLRYYTATGALPDVVVRMSRILGLESNEYLTYGSRDPLDRLVSRSSKYRLTAKRATYSVYQRRNAGCLGSAG
jgi:hypothetical protein